MECQELCEMVSDHGVVENKDLTEAAWECVECVRRLTFPVAALDSELVGAASVSHHPPVTTKMSEHPSLNN